MASGGTLRDILESWQKKQNQQKRLLFELRTTDKALGDFASAAKVLIGQGATTGDRARDIAIGVHGTLEPQVVHFYRQIESELAGCVGQLTLVVKRVSNDDWRINGQGEEGAVGLRAPDRPDPNWRLSVGRLLGKELIFDHKKMEVSFPTNREIVTCTTDWDCLIFINHGGPKIELVNLPLKVSTEDLLAFIDGRPMPSQMSILIGDKAIKQWFEKNASLGTLQRLDDAPTLWDKTLACFNPASAASIDSGL